VAVGSLGFVLLRVIKGKTTTVVLLPVAILAVVVLLANLPGQLRRVAPPNGSGDSGPE
jgi:hypothetical protein